MLLPSMKNLIIEETLWAIAGSLYPMHSLVAEVSLLDL